MAGSPYSMESLRRGAWHYLSGRAISAVLTIAIQLWLVRLLSISDYGIYITLQAGLGLGFVFAGMGLHWVVARYVPAYRLGASAAQTRRFVWRISGYRLVALLAVAVAWLFSARVFPDWIALDTSRGAVILLLSALLVVQGMGAFLLDSVLAALVQQHIARTSQIARQLCWLALLGVATWYGGGSLVHVLMAELVASSLGLVIAMVGLRAELRAAEQDVASPNDWKDPTPREIWHTCSRIYAADLLSLFSGVQVLTLLLQRFAGNEAVGLFGFLCVLHSQLSRYLPANLLFSLIQAKLAASYFDGGGMPELARNANLAGKMSLFVLMPIIAITAISGEALIDVLSGGRFPQTGLLFFTTMLAMIPGSQGHLVYTVAVVSGHTQLCTIASLTGLLTFPLMWSLLQFNLGAWAAVISMVVSDLLVVGVLTVALSVRTSYRMEFNVLTKLGISALIAWVCATLVPPHTSAWLSIVSMSAVVLIAYGAAVFFLKPFTLLERTRLRKIFGRT